MSATDVVADLQEAVSSTKDVVEKEKVESPQKRKLEDQTSDEHVDAKKSRTEEATVAVGDVAEPTAPIAESESDTKSAENTDSEKTEGDVVDENVDRIWSVSVLKVNLLKAEDLPENFCAESKAKEIEDAIHKSTIEDRTGYLTLVTKAALNLLIPEYRASVIDSLDEKFDFAGSHYNDEVSQEKVRQLVIKFIASPTVDFDINEVAPIEV